MYVLFAALGRLAFSTTALGPLSYLGHSALPLCSLRRLIRPNLIFGKLRLWKMYIWEVATWEIVTSEVAIGKMPLGK